MRRLLPAYFATLAAFCALDFAWLALVAGNWYSSQLGALLLPAPNWAAALPFYPLYVLGIVHFCVRPAAGVPTRGAAAGALFGLCAYATYDLTNLATIAGWTPAVAIVDLTWGVVVTAVAAWVGARVAGRAGAGPRA